MTASLREPVPPNQSIRGRFLAPSPVPLLNLVYAKMDAFLEELQSLQVAVWTPAYLLEQTRATARPS